MHSLQWGLQGREVLGWHVYGCYASTNSISLAESWFPLTAATLAFPSGSPPLRQAGYGMWCDQHTSLESRAEGVFLPVPSVPGPVSLGSGLLNL